MPSSFTPTLFYKDGVIQIANTPTEYWQFIYDGWVNGGPAEALSGTNTTPPTPDWTVVEVRGTLIDSTGAPIVGRIRFRPRASRSKDLGNLIDIVGREIIAVINPDGTFSVELPATNDPSTTPNDFTWEVIEEFIGGGSLPPFEISVPIESEEDGIEYTLVSSEGLVSQGTPSYVPEVLQARADAVAAAAAAADSAESAAASAVVAQRMGIDVKANGAVGDGVTDDTAALTAVRDSAAAFGAAVYVPKGIYLIGDIVLSQANQVWNLHPEAVFKYKPTTGAGTHCAFRITASGVKLRGGGTVDANRDNQNKTAFNAAGGSAGGWARPGIQVEGTSGTPLTDVEIDLRIINSIDSGMYALWVNDSKFTVTVENSGSGAVQNNVRHTYNDFTYVDIDNDGWKVYPHAHDTIACYNLYGPGVVSTGQYGDGKPVDGTSLSGWVSGWTSVESERISYQNVYFETRESDAMNPGVASSFLTTSGITIGSWTMIGWSDVNVEMGGLTDATFTNVHIDGRYQACNNGLLLTPGRGFAAYDNGFLSDFSGRVTRATEDISVTNFVIKRLLGNAIDLWVARDTRWVNGKIFGNDRGVFAKYLPVAGVDSTPTPENPISGHHFTNVSCRYNERDGWYMIDAANWTFNACDGTNNGQAHTMGVTRRGASLGTGQASGFNSNDGGDGRLNTGLQWYACSADDTQTFTGVFGTDPTRPNVLIMDNDEHYEIGQAVKATGAGAAGADLVELVNNKNRDELTINGVVETFATPAGVGTISTVGTAVTGVGTQFLTEFPGRFFIKVGADVRRIRKAPDNTHATIDSAFPVDLAGAAFTVYRAVSVGIPSQQYGYRFKSETIAPQIFGGHVPTGNVLGSSLDDNINNSNCARWISVFGTVSVFGNSVNSVGFLRAQYGSAGVVEMGQIGPASQAGIRASNEVSWYHSATDTWRTDDAVRIGDYLGLKAVAGAVADASFLHTPPTTGTVPIAVDVTNSRVYFKVEGTWKYIDITDDLSKPVSTAVTAAISAAINGLINSAPGTLDTLGEIATQMAADESAATAILAALTAHTGASSGAHAATAISNTPAGTVSATTVQAAINELDTEKISITAAQAALDLKTDTAARSDYWTGGYIWPQGPVGAYLYAAGDEGKAYFTPIPLGHGMSLDQLLLEITVAGSVGAVIRLGIALPDANGLPKTLLAEATTLVDGTAAAVGVPVAQSLSPAAVVAAAQAGKVYLVSKLEGGATTRPTVRCLTGAGAFQMASNSLSHTQFTLNGYIQTGLGTGAFPSTFTVTGLTGTAPRVGARMV